MTDDATTATDATTGAQPRPVAADGSWRASRCSSRACRSWSRRSPSGRTRSRSRPTGSRRSSARSSTSRRSSTRWPSGSASRSSSALDVQTRIENRLPDIAKPLAAPLTVQIQEAIDRRLQTALADPEIPDRPDQRWSRSAHERIINLLRGEFERDLRRRRLRRHRGLACRRRRPRGSCSRTGSSRPTSSCPTCRHPNRRASCPAVWRPRSGSACRPISGRSS